MENTEIKELNDTPTPAPRKKSKAKIIVPIILAVIAVILIAAILLTVMVPVVLFVCFGIGYYLVVEVLIGDVEYVTDATANTCYVSGITGNIPHEVAINETYNGATVIGVEAHAFEGNQNVTVLYLPSTLEYIGDFAFAGAGKLSAVYLDSNSVYIGERAFADLSQSLEIFFPGTIEDWEAMYVSESWCEGSDISVRIADSGILPADILPTDTPLNLSSVS